MTMRSLFLYILGFSHLIIAQDQQRTGCFNYYLASESKPLTEKSQEKPALAPRNIFTSRTKVNSLAVRGWESNPDDLGILENKFEDESQGGGRLKYVDTAFKV